MVNIDTRDTQGLTHVEISEEYLKEYINSKDTVYANDFCKEIGVTPSYFKGCIKEVKISNPELYNKFKEVNMAARLGQPIACLQAIAEGIQSGKTLDGREFNVLEFYKLAPFKNVDFHQEMIQLINAYPKLAKIHMIRKAISSTKYDMGLVKNSWSEDLYCFAQCISSDLAKTLRLYMIENKIANITPIGQASIVNVYKGVTDKNTFNERDAKNIFKYMERNNLPKCLEVYNILKDSIVESKTRTRK